MQKIARIYEPKLLFFFMRTGVLIVNYNFNPCGIFENMTSFSPVLNQGLEQGKLMAVVNIRE